MIYSGRNLTAKPRAVGRPVHRGSGPGPVWPGGSTSRVGSRLASRPGSGANLAGRITPETRVRRACRPAGIRRFECRRRGRPEGNHERRGDFIPGIATRFQPGREPRARPLFHSGPCQRAPIANDFGSTVSGSVIGGRASPAASDGLGIHPEDGTTPSPVSGVAVPVRHFQPPSPFVGCLLHLQNAVHHIRRRSCLPPVRSDLVPVLRVQVTGQEV